MHRTNLARPAAAVLVLVWALAIPAAGGLISDVGAIPNPFSPNADGVLDSTAIYYSLAELADVVVSVADSAGIGFLTLWSGWEDEGTHSHWWDGRFEDSFVADGEYRFLIKAVPESGSSYEEEEVEFPFVVDTEAPPLHDVEVVPSRFSPDGDGVGDSLMIRFDAGVSEPSDQVLVTILDGDDEPVRQIYSSTGIASAVLFWDGADETGAVASDGLFFVRVETRDAAGNQAESGALVDLDTAPPDLSVDDLDTTAMEIRVDSSVAELTGWAYDRAGVVSVELSVDQGEWTEVALGRPDTVTWAGSVACESCLADSLDETVQLLVRAHDGTPTADGQGHVNDSSTSAPMLSFDVVFDVAPPRHESSTLSGGNDTFEPDETITITTTWDNDRYTVTADFSQVDGESDSLDVAWISGDRYSVTYEIPAADSLVLPVEDAQVFITATDGFGRRVTVEAVTVTVLPGSSDDPAGVLRLDVNSFEPMAGGKVVITLGAHEGTATVSVYNMAGTLVRTLESQDDEIRWYGDNDAGDSVASGVYFLRIQVGESESVRKVAVIR